jgi:hypothetical protein
VPSLEIRKNGTKLEKSASSKEFDRFQSRHFFPLRVNFSFLQLGLSLGNSLEAFFIFGIDRTYQHI